jgi:hypothetical protein
MRVAAPAIAAIALASAGVTLAVGPPQPPQPTGTTSTVATVPTVSASGLRGYVSVGPTSPTCSPGEACSRPARVTLRFWRNGRLVLRVTTRATGVYRAPLAPGLYLVRAARTLGLLKPSVVRVPVERWRRIDFVLSTGIY